MLLLATSSPTILVGHPKLPLLPVMTVQKEEGVIRGGNGNNDVPQVMGEDERCDGQPGPASAAHLSLGQEGTALTTCPR
jgi:hypothetical protein